MNHSNTDRFALLVTIELFNWVQQKLLVVLRWSTQRVLFNFVYLWTHFLFKCSYFILQIYQVSWYKASSNNDCHQLQLTSIQFAVHMLTQHGSINAGAKVNLMSVGSPVVMMTSAKINLLAFLQRRRFVNLWVVNNRTGLCSLLRKLCTVCHDDERR